MSARTGRALLLAFQAAASGPLAASPVTNDFSGLVDIGVGRKMYVECRGSGSPTVVLISGKGNGAADWSEMLDPGDPAHDAGYDLVSSGLGEPRESDSAVFPAVSRLTRVCAYDRPGTRLEGRDVSTPVPQPHTVDQAVRDLRALLAAAGETGPYLLVPHSYGGLVAMLYARTHPDEVAGLVMVDAASERIEQVVSAEALGAWDAGNRLSIPQAPEAVEILDAIERIEAAPPLPARPAVVLSADKPWHPPASDGTAAAAPVTFADWLAAQELLAESLDARHVTKTDSGHNVYLYDPNLVVDAIREVVGEARGE
jgi:pimeloyl-ACP methyl ester carboxylesterase